MVHEVECFARTHSILGENPLWHAATHTLYAIDCMGRCLQRINASGTVTESWRLPRTPGSFAWRADGSLLMAYRRSIALITPGTDRLDEIPTPDIDFDIAVFNDGKCDRRGRFWAGTMDRQIQSPVGALYRVDADLSVHRMDSGITLSNGIAWSPDDRTMYYCDSRPGPIIAYDYDIAFGGIANRRVLVDFAERDGHPDGCTVDAEGGLWVAEVGAGKVVRFDPIRARDGLRRLAGLTADQRDIRWCRDAQTVRHQHALWPQRRAASGRASGGLHLRRRTRPGGFAGALFRGLTGWFEQRVQPVLLEFAVD